ncbi:serine/threonine-protein kinase [Pseudanabaena sp. FACHB-2040]|uniref:serine/threonine-protein kinase n=1 Tax=Pseudanabaena sp. FACHB-2040 TaxID=2692859 RepID=UPI001684538E|nr:serine/threonine-protein kinase [Pseudanabaena sp. FACHB-2040]MBD2257015.1 protein kinase [Pseudanabaena sp. FACHB-2040]
MFGLGQGGMLLGGRYRVVRELGRGGFGHTYLAEDANRFQEMCVLKEFVPQVEGEAALEKAQQLFAREANILYQLDHPQIPRFRELFREGGRLFLVQDYVEGPTYQELLETRRRYAGQFSENEVAMLLRQVLPVLQYLHSLGIVHRDISPDNLIQRNADGLPVLIDFGGVKQLVVNVRYQLGVEQPYANADGQVTRLGKAGYAPAEQLDSGVANPSSDLYALGVTVLVLLTSEEPEALFDQRSQTWQWQEKVRVSPALATVLNRLVAPRASDRYATADQVMADFHIAAYDSGSWQSSLPIRMQPMTPPPPPPLPDPPAPRRKSTPQPPRGPAYISLTDPPYAPLPQPTASYTPPLIEEPVEPRPRPTPRSSSGCLQALLGLLVLLGVVGLGWWGLTASGWLDNIAIPGGSDVGGPDISEEEQTRKRATTERAQALGVDNSYLTQLTDQLFYERYPDLRGTQLTSSPEDAALRTEWDAIANDMLTLTEQNLSTAARQRLGRYNSSDLDRWRAQVNQLYVSRRALYDLADARYGNLFPGRVNDGFVEEPTSQIWFALAQDRVNALESGQKLTEISFQPGTYSQQIQVNLDPGEGQVYTLNLNSGQLLRLNLQPSSPETLLSLYLPSPTDEDPYLLSDSSNTTWSGELTQTGYYEIVVVSTAQQPITYQLNVAVDTVITNPAEPPAASADKD